MNDAELDKLLQDIKELKRAVRKANPFFRSVVALRLYAYMSIPLGIATLAFCWAAQYLVRSYGSFAAIPSAWKTAFWATLCVIGTSGIALKWIAVGKRAAAIEKGATFATVVKAMYGGSWVNMNLAVTICMAVMIAFAIWVGHAWYIVPTLAVSLGFICISMALSVERKEYLVTGWFAFASGLASLFFIESAPFIWTAAVWGGILLVYGVSGLIYVPREEREGMKDRAKAVSSLDLDKVIHERARLRILTFLASSDAGEVGFTELRDALGFTAGNLSVQIKTLEEAGYLGVEKRFVANKSFTGLRLTQAGERALTAYLAELEIIVESLKLGVKAPKGAAGTDKGGNV